ncbi:MAG: hypothetical protein M1818_001424 [Claussenomyces sp. TS43310]|nr:MAG: hypothetical protein M1818_001424 [Claussenomyces sp. TS43310]
MASASIIAIRDSVPPVSDYLTYLTIVESHLSPEILPTLNDILQDQVLTQNIGWDLIQLLLPIPGSEACLTTIARLGNPREVVLKVTEALTLLNRDKTGDEEQEQYQSLEDQGNLPSSPRVMRKASDNAEDRTEPTTVDTFCTLLSLLSILHPRIKTKYPSRFLSSSLIAVLSAYRASHQATHAVTSFVHALSAKKRPLLPQRKSSIASPIHQGNKQDKVAPDPEATAEDPQEAAIQKRLLQSFVTHILEEYVMVNSIEWAARLQEHFEPSKVVPSRRSFGEAFREDPDLAERDVCVGQLVARAFDLGLSGYAFLFDDILNAPPPPASHIEAEENMPSSPEDIPLSHVGSLFLITSFIFSAILFDSHVALPHLALFPEHVKLAKHFLSTTCPQSIGTEHRSVIDAFLAIGLWLENSNRFVTGGLDDEEFLQHLQTLSLLSANTPTPTLRYHAHLLTSSILHAHPVDRTRLTFISDTLEHCPYENLKASAVGWLKDEFIIADQRKSETLFSTTIALAATQPYLFPDLSSWDKTNELELLEGLLTSYPFHMAVVNFLIFVSGKGYTHVLPSTTLAVAENIYLRPLRKAQERLEAALSPEGEMHQGMGDIEAGVALGEVQLLGERLTTCLV